MKRRNFIKDSAAFSLGMGFFSTFFSACEDDLFFPTFDVNFNGKVLIIGAGAAGLTAGYVLNKYNIDFEIIEASSVFGGRVKKIDGFADFPIDLGAEWIHTEPSIFARLVGHNSINVDVETIVYNPQTISSWKNGKLKRTNFVRNFYSEYKFKSTTWYDFLETYLVPSISDKIIYDSPVNEIDYTSGKVIVKTTNGDIHEADKVIVTIPIQILKNNFIDFSPNLPQEKIDAINTINIPEGLKIFIEFSERFYPDLVQNGLFPEYEKALYDAAFRKDTNRNILGLFTIGTPAAAFTSLTDEEIIAKYLDELDEIFDGKASQYYIKHVIQNWSKEPFIQGSYSHFTDRYYPTMETLLKPIDNKIYFAGEALNMDGNTATVHGASESGYVAVEAVLK